MSPLYQIKAPSLLSFVQLCLWSRLSLVSHTSSPTHGVREMQSGFLVAVPLRCGRLPQTGAGFCFLICVQVGTEEMAWVRICRGKCRLLAPANRGVAGDEAGSSQIPQTSGGESDVSHLCPTKVTRAALWEGKGSEAAGPGCLGHLGTWWRGSTDDESGELVGW